MWRAKTQNHQQKITKKMIQLLLLRKEQDSRTKNKKQIKKKERNLVCKMMKVNKVLVQQYKEKYIRNNGVSVCVWRWRWWWIGEVHFWRRKNLKRLFVTNSIISLTTSKRLLRLLQYLCWQYYTIYINNSLEVGNEIIEFVTI